MTNFEYYKSIGCTDAQSKVLSTLSYGGYADNIINAYYKSSSFVNTKSFCEDFCEYLTHVDGIINDFDIGAFYIHCKTNNCKYDDIKDEYIKYQNALQHRTMSPFAIFGAGGLGAGSGVDTCGFGAAPQSAKKTKSASRGIRGVFSKKDRGLPSFLTNMSSMDGVHASMSMSESASFEAEAEFDACDADFGAMPSPMPSPMASPMRSPLQERISEDFVKALDTERFEHIDEKGFRETVTSPTSNFKTNCNTVTIDMMRTRTSPVEASKIRTEEFINYFNYDLRDAEADNMFGIQAKLFDKPSSKNKMLLVGIKGKNVLPTKQNVVILLDVSGSMSGNNEWTQASMITFIKKLNDGDKLSLITYSSDDKTVIDDITYSSDKLDKIIEKILSININGYTYGSKGLNSAYELISKNMIKDGVNRVVIITDGDFNFGDNSIDSIKKLISEKKETGAYLSVVGTGNWNTNDELMETLAKNGNGNYSFINCMEDVDNNINKKYNKLMFTIATDVKAEVEFNPKYVKRYRLIGYENREISREEFNDDTVVAEPFGCGNHAIALYEIEMADDTKVESGLKYQTTSVVDSDELCTVSVRYKELGEKESKLQSRAVRFEVTDMDTDCKKAYSAAVLAEKLRESNTVEEVDIAIAKKMINELAEDDKCDTKLDLIKSLF